LKYFIFLDCPTLSSTALGLAVEGEKVIVGVGGYSPNRPPMPGEILLLAEELTVDFIKSLGVNHDDRIIIGACDPDLFTPVTCAFSPAQPAPSILFISERAVSSEAGARPNVSVVNVAESARSMLAREWKGISTRKRAFRLWSILRDAERVLILTQNDPDPDAIASGMAVQALLAMGADTAPICTFGRVTRNENRAMLRLLGTRVRTIKREDARNFDKVVMVDVAPPYFKGGAPIEADVVIDHHPYPAAYRSSFRLVDVSCGATATIMTELLAAAGVEISQRLATALLYGVITDTMLLAREASTRDFEAFNTLWPLANHELLAGMSRPRLGPEELDYFVKAIEDREEFGKFLFIWLGAVKREDIIPRIADFSMQIGDSSVCAVGGLYGRNAVISIRNADPDLDAGVMASTLFGEFGSAGGHRTMAKAVAPAARLEKNVGKHGRVDLRGVILRIFMEFGKNQPPARRTVKRGRPAMSRKKKS